MKQGFGMSQRLYLKQALTIEQSLRLRQILKQSQELRDPADQNALRGIEGLRTADELLQERDLRGILIGSVAESVWNARRTTDELNAHKDVDVMVLDQPSLERSTEYPKKFEGGIDWWLPKRQVIGTAGSGSITPIRYWQNANGVTLFFNISDYRTQEIQKMVPGLHIPNPEWISTVRANEAEVASEDQIPPAVAQKFKERKRKEMGKVLMPALKKGFEGFIVDESTLRPADTWEIKKLQAYWRGEVK